MATREAVMKKLNGRAVDLLFIDGDHRYSRVKKDFEMYAPLVRTGGVVLLHDILLHP
jgi:predicted O-methyltransferase YrrM